MLAAMAASAVVLVSAAAASANSILSIAAFPDQTNVTLVAAAAKQNRVVVGLTGNSITVTDASDPIDESAPECSGGGTNTVACTFATPLFSVSVNVGDLDDSIRVDAPQGVPGIQGGEGFLSLVGGDGGDEITVVAPPGAPGSASLVGDGNDPAGDGSDILIGGGMRDGLSGDGSVDVLLGGDGDDNMFPGPGNGDRAEGGPGDDAIVYAAGEGTGELLDGGAGVDTIAVRDDGVSFSQGPTAMTVDLAAGTLNQTGGGSAAVSALGFEFLSGFATAVTVAGTDGHNELTTHTADDLVDPRAGPDLVSVGAGADRVLARDGFADRIECGPGVDMVQVDQFDELFDCESVDLAAVLAAGVELEPPGCEVTGVRRTLRRKRFLTRELRPAVGCDEAVALEARLTVGVRRRRGRLVTTRAGQLVLAEQALPLAGGTRRLSLKVPRRLRSVLGRRFAARLIVVARDQFGNRAAITRVVRVR